jgi:glucan-binding YG repeat protein
VYTAKYDETVRKYTVEYKNGDEVLASYEVEYEAAVPAYEGETPVKEGNAQYSYTFAGWDPAIAEGAKVTENMTFTAQFTESVNSYKVTWKVDGQEDLVETYEYNTMPSYKNGATPTKEPTAEFTYTFAGWEPAVVAVTGDATYTAKFMEVKRSYTVTWLNADGTTFATTTVAYGDMPTAPESTPTKAAAANETGSYTFTGWTPELAVVEGDQTYTASFSYTGWRTDETGKQYFIDSELQKTGLTEIDGAKYYLDPETGYAAQSTVVSTEEGDPGHAFDADGKWMEGCKEQVFKDEKNDEIYLVKDGIVEVYPGLYKTENDEYYYFGEDNKAYRGEIKWVEKNHSDPNNEADRGLLPKWDYEFGEDGIIKHEDVNLDGIQVIDGVKYYYIDGIRVHYGMFFEDGYYYYADRSGKLITSKTYWCTDNYGLMEEGPYTFDDEGHMILTEKKNGIYYEDNSIFFYKDGSRYYAGLILVDETNPVKVHKDGIVSDAEPGYYYVRTEGELAHSRNYWITKTNDLLPEKAYRFLDNGKIDFDKNGIYAEDGSLFYYKDGMRFYAGLIKIDGAYYYVKTNCEVVHGRSYWITKTNGLMPEKAYTFADDGKMILDVPESGDSKNGIVAENGSLWYYVDGKLTYAGLIEIDGAYYYVRTNGEVVHGRSYWITKTNGLMPEKAYDFADDGKMILP